MFGGFGGSGDELRTEFAVLRQRFNDIACGPNNLLQGAPGDGGGDCSIEPRNILETYFETGDIPTESQFEARTEKIKFKQEFRPNPGQ